MSSHGLWGAEFSASAVRRCKYLMKKALQPHPMLKINEDEKTKAKMVEQLKGFKPSRYFFASPTTSHTPAQDADVPCTPMPTIAASRTPLPCGRRSQVV